MITKSMTMLINTRVMLSYKKDTNSRRNNTLDNSCTVFREKHDQQSVLIPKSSAGIFFTLSNSSHVCFSH